MTARARFRALRDRGVTIVEAALVFPLLLLFIFGLIDIGQGVFQTSQATSAARDGARVAILDHRTADVPGSADHEAAVAEVEARLVGQDTESVAIRCKRPTGVTVSCAAAAPRVDLVEVVVRWTYRPITFAGDLVGPRAITGSASMVIVGRPVSTTPLPPVPTTQPEGPGDPGDPGDPVPGACAVEGGTLSPSVNTRQQSGFLATDFTVTVTTNGEPTCTGMKVRLPVVNNQGAETTVDVALQGTTPGFSVTVRRNDHKWSTGAKTLEIHHDGSSTPIGTVTMTIN
jgi:Flp pilus assembly protein TadG